MLIQLGKFNPQYWDSLPKDKKELYYKPQKGFYHVLLVDGEKAGIAGVFLSEEEEGVGFFQIYLGEEFRGKGLLKKAAVLIYKKYSLKKLISTIKKYNTASIKSHLKSGFVEEDHEKQKKLIKEGWQKSDEIRFVWSQ